MDINKIGLKGLLELEKEFGVGSNEQAAKLSEKVALLNPEGGDGSGDADLDPGVTPREITPLHNATQPAFNLQKEQPRHRLICVLKAAGHTNKEIAEMVDCSLPQVAYVVGQPWSQEIILQEINRTGDSALKRLHAASIEAAEKLIEVMRTTKNDEVKRKTANDILDRKFGKPNQPMSVQTKPAEQMTDDELAKLVQGGSN